MCVCVFFDIIIIIVADVAFQTMSKLKKRFPTKTGEDDIVMHFLFQFDVIRLLI